MANPSTEYCADAAITPSHRIKDARTAGAILSAKNSTTEGFIMTPVPIRRALASLPVKATKSRRNKNKEMGIPSRGWLHNIGKEGPSPVSSGKGEDAGVSRRSKR